MTLDCPNNRYVNDERICPALAAMWAQIGVAHNAETNHIPLHGQVIPWTTRSNVTAVHRADNNVIPYWVTIQ